MLILLPPSQGKASTDDALPFDIGALSLSGLTPTRERIAAALAKLSTGRESRACKVLGLTPRQTDELARNRELLDARALPASQVYTGVLYAALDYLTLTAAARCRVDQWVLVFSGLWGAVHLDDAIPAYRLAGDVTLPRLGSVAALWRKPLTTAIPEAAGQGVVLDLRSGTYAKMWSPDPEVAERTVVARILQERPDGSRAVVSHHNKATKGRLIRALASQGKTPSTVEALAALIEAQGVITELHVGRPGKPWGLDVVVDEP
ncbi:MAG: peroxide stress protein YaaA [Actinomycetia bacterium]|nr:peroxide stress protein YaaA [Actinomycetes bacterium]